MHENVQKHAGQQLQVMIRHQNDDEFDLYDFNCGVVAGATWAVLSISEMGNLLGILHTTQKSGKTY